MYLFLNLDGIKTSFEIVNYAPTLEEYNNNTPCITSLSLYYKDLLDYKVKGKKIFLPSELDALRDALKKLLLDEISEETIISFDEWDFVFILHPKAINYQVSLFGDCPEVQEAYVEWCINLCLDDLGYTRNSITLRMTIEQVEYFKNYLNYITKTIDDTNSIVELMYNENIFIDGTI